MMNTKVTQSQITQMIQGANNGFSTRETAAALGLSHITVSRYLRKSGITRKKRTINFTNT